MDQATITTRNETGLSESAALGRRVATFEGFDTFPAPQAVRRVELRSAEVTAMCPVTGQPDFYTITVAYAPADRCLESKSFKLYLQTFRNTGMFCEALAARIEEDVRGALAPQALAVRVEQSPRGGIGLTAVAGDDEVLAWMR